MSAFSVKSLSPAYWYVCSSEKAKRERGRGQVGRAYATKADAERACHRFTISELEMVREFRGLMAP